MIDGEDQPGLALHRRLDVVVFSEPELECRCLRDLTLPDVDDLKGDHPLVSRVRSDGGVVLVTIPTNARSDLARASSTIEDWLALNMAPQTACAGAEEMVALARDPISTDTARRFTGEVNTTRL